MLSTLFCKAVAVWHVVTRETLTGLTEGLDGWHPGGQQPLHHKLSPIVCSGARLEVGLLTAAAGQRPTLITFTIDKKLWGL